MRLGMLVVGVVLIVSGSLPAYAAKPKVVATISIIGDVIEHVAGDSIDLTILVGANGDAHEFEPTPSDSLVLAKADVIFENGLFLEHWLDKLYSASGSKARRIVCTQGVVPSSIGDNAHEIDPHAWQDVSNVIMYTKNVRDALIEIDQDNKGRYEANAQRYIQQLESLDAWIRLQVATIPESKRKLITNHDALGYFARKYGFKIVGAAIPSATTEAGDPSAKQTAQLLNIIKSSGVKAVFSEHMASVKLVQALSKEAGVIVAPGLYTDALGVLGSEGETYIKMMRHNVAIFVEYLK